MQWKKTVSPLISKVEMTLPVIIRVNKFTEESANTFIDQMSTAHNTGQPVIPVVIDSYGGQVYSLMAMISAIKAATLPVATIVEGKAMSCGAILASFGNEGMRYAAPESTMMIHDVSTHAFGKVEEVKASSEEAKRLNDRVYRMMAMNCGKDPEYFLEIVHEKGHADWYLDIDEMVEHGIINHKRLPTLSMNIDVKMKFQ